MTIPANSATITSRGSTGRAAAGTDTHPFLSGIHRPLAKEFTLTELSVEGELPAMLSGRYVRIGPNPVNPDPEHYHWFAGAGMIHGLAIEGGRALWYRNRWIRSVAVSEALGGPPAPGPRHHRNDVVNTNVIGLAGEVWALVEAGSYPVVLSLDLEQQAYSAFGDTLSGSFSAHPHEDPSTGYFHAVAYEGGAMNQVRHVVVAPDGRVVREEPIAVQDGPSIHDCAVTANYVIVLDLPVTLSVDAVRKGMDFPFRWNDLHPARVGLLRKDRPGSSIIWCDIDACYVFHTGNAWEMADGTVVLDVVAYETMFDGADGGPGGRCLGIERWMVHPAAQAVTRQSIDPAAQEFPRYDERRTSCPTRYLYTVSAADVGSPMPSCIYKHDSETGLRETHDFGPGCVPGEFVFVPECADGPEDAGWMIGLVINSVADTTDLIVLDACTFAAPPIAKIGLPHRVPPGFHGNWIANKQSPHDASVEYRK